MEYKLIEEWNGIEHFEADIAARIADGWKPLGGVSVLYKAPYTTPNGDVDWGGLAYLQAMVKE